MEGKLKELNGKSFLVIESREEALSGDEYSLDLISLCAFYNVDLLLFEKTALPDDFFDLRTGFAGTLLQKFSNYRIRAALLIDEDKLTGRFAEFAFETNKGKTFRLFSDKAEAEQWLTR